PKDKTKQKILAMRVKQRVYRSQRGAKEYKITKDNFNLYLGYYKQPWDRFQEFMDENYDAFHKDPARFTDFDLGDTPIPPKPPATDMAKETGWDETIQQHIVTLTEKGHDYNTYKTAAFALSNIAKNKPELSQQVIDALEDILTTDGVKHPVFMFAAYALSGFVQDKSEFSQQAMDVLEGILTKDGLESGAYWNAAGALSGIVQDKSEFSQQAMDVLEGILTKDSLKNLASKAAANALQTIVENDPELIRPSTVEASEGILTKDGLKSFAYATTTNALYSIAIYRPELIQSSTVEALGGVLTKNGLESNAYRYATEALSDIAKNRPEFFDRIYSILQGLIDKDITEQEGLLKEAILRNLPDKIPASAIERIKNLDWPIILSTAGLTEIDKEDIAPIIKAAGKTAKHRTEQKILAMRVKQRVYRELRGKEEYEITKDNFNLYLGYYKLPWDRFLVFMDKHYDAFHENPDEFTAFDPADIPVPPKPPATDMAKETGLDEVIQQYITTLTDRGHDCDTYKAAANALSDIVISNPKLRQQAMNALEGILTTDDLESDAYESAANALYNIAINNPKLIQPSTMEALEGILTTDGLESNLYTYAAIILSNIAENNPKLIQPSTVEALEGILIKDCLEDSTWNYYWQAANALSNIARNRPRLSQQAIEALEGILAKDGFESDAYRVTAYILRDIAKNKPELIQPSTVEALGGILTRDGLESLVYSAAANALSSIAENNPDLFDRVYSVLQNLIDKGITEQEGLLKEAILENLPDQIPASAIGRIENLDWSIILSSAGLQEIDKEDIAPIIQAAGDKPKHRTEQKILAMRVKQRVYRELRRKRKYKITEDNFNLYLGYYKLPWDRFLVFMDENYDAFHKNPEEFTEFDLGDTPIPPKPNATDMAKENGLGKTIQPYIATLTERRRDYNTYHFAANALRNIARTNPELSQQAMNALEGILTTDGIEGDA
ncbi:hypothetical protein OAA99_03065, partial [Omnitrophica bacterium]|nr:hypothetical protein [Candidatus Omnitrophota bacterium]